MINSSQEVSAEGGSEEGGVRGNYSFFSRLKDKSRNILYGLALIVGMGAGGCFGNGGSTNRRQDDLNRHDYISYGAGIASQNPNTPLAYRLGMTATSFLEGKKGDRQAQRENSERIAQAIRERNKQESKKEIVRVKSFEEVYEEARTRQTSSPTPQRQVNTQPELISFYMTTDINRDGKLSEEEINMNLIKANKKDYVCLVVAMKNCYGRTINLYQILDGERKLVSRRTHNFLDGYHLFWWEYDRNVSNSSVYNYEAEVVGVGTLPLQFEVTE